MRFIFAQRLRNSFTINVLFMTTHEIRPRFLLLSPRNGVPFSVPIVPIVVIGIE